MGTGRRVATLTLATVLCFVSVLVLAEFGLAASKDGGYPGLNIFRVHHTYGVALDPSAHTRLAFWDGPVQDVRTNSAGYRSAELPVSGADEILVLGDSLVFGLGVADHETFPAVMAGEHGLSAHNLAVPAYGLLEFEAQAAELLPARRPSTLVLTISLGRHYTTLGKAVRDRWTATHGWMHPLPGMSNEGTMPARREIRAPDLPGVAWLVRRSHLVDAWRRSGSRERDSKSRGRKKKLAESMHRTQRATLTRWKGLLDEARKTQQARALYKGTPYYMQNESGKPRGWAPVAAQLQRIRALSEAHGTRLVVLVLPPDVYVSEGQWAKYGFDAKDGRRVDLLMQDLRHTAMALGITLIDPTDALAEAGDAAFLQSDWHMSAVGHRAVAAAVVAGLGQRDPEARPPELIPALTGPDPL